MSPHPKTTLWIWPTGLFPRRLVYYFRAKNITLSILQAYNIQLVPVTLSKNSLASLPGYETRPADTSLPIMRVEEESGTFYVRESIAILEYFEEVFKVETEYEDMRGKTLQQRVKTRDILSLLADAAGWSGVSLIHSNPATTHWSGLGREAMSEGAAAHAKMKFCAQMDKLERWVGESKGSLSGVGTGVTLADVCLMAQVEYMQEVYGMNWLEGFVWLRAWCNRKSQEEWVVKKEGLEGVEKSGEWNGVLEI
jgi:glutathione S-transferase